MPHPELVLTCEHASNAVPPGFDPGVGPEVLASHLGWDIGALDAARVVAERTGARLIAGAWTRLYVDLNRMAEAPASVPGVSCGVSIPGNQGLAPGEREERLARVHAPYRAEVLAAAERAVLGAGLCVHVSVHSFTPVLYEQPRPFDVGILFDPAHALEAAMARVLVDGFRAAGRTTRENEPYAGTDDGVTTWLRGRFGPKAYGGIEVELNQALTASGAAARALGETLASLIPAVVAAARKL